MDRPAFGQITLRNGRKALPVHYLEEQNITNTQFLESSLFLCHDALPTHSTLLKNIYRLLQEVKS